MEVTVLRLRVMIGNEHEQPPAGRQKALKLLATSAKVSASEALELGLIDEIVENSNDSINEVKATDAY
jgi:ATP-dependent protease ClpP protease subunit